MFDGVALPREYANVAYLPASEVNIGALAELLNKRVWDEARDGWIAEGDLLKKINHDITSGVIQDDIAAKIEARTDEIEQLRGAVIGTLAAFPYQLLRPKARGFLRFLALTHGPVSTLFDENRHYKFADPDVVVLLRPTTDALVMFPVAWFERLKPELERRVSAFGSGADKEGHEE